MNKSDFLNLIDARNNGVIDKLKECNDNGLRLFIYGAGEGAENIEKRFDKVKYISQIQFHKK